MSFILLGILNSQASGVAQTYFLSVLGGTGAEGFAPGIGLDSSNNSYIVGNTDSAGAGGRDVLIAKYETTGIVEWQRTLGGVDNEEGRGVAIDSSNNVYACGLSGDFKFLLAKYDSSGTIQWQRTLDANQGANAIAVDSTGNVYLLGSDTVQGEGSFELTLAKYDSSGTLQWQRILGTDGVEIGRGLAIDSLNNIYAAGQTSGSGAGGIDILLAKYDSSGTIQWQRTFGGSLGEVDGPDGIDVDSSDNVYITTETRSEGVGNRDVAVVKYDSSGTLQWQRILGGSGNDDGNSISIDSEDNLYIAGTTDSDGAGSVDILLAKYNNSGTIQWQRTLGGSGLERGWSLDIDSFDNLHVVGVTSSTGAGGNDFLLAKLPNDGTLEGTYSLDGNSIIYQASSLTAATSTLTSASSSLVSATSTFTSATSTLTSATANLDSETIEIG